jgi:hypothetical protein
VLALPNDRPLQQKETKQTKNPRWISRQKLLVLLVEELLSSAPNCVGEPIPLAIALPGR